MTSLIDVIFLLLLFFMLSSTFSRFAEVEITVGGSSAGATAPSAESRLLFLRLADTAMTLNGQPVTREALRASILEGDTPATLLMSVTTSVSAQMLTDVLVELRSLPDVTLTVLEAS